MAPARSSDAYEGKAATTAASALSGVRTAILVADAANRDGLFSPQVSVALSDAEETVSSADGLFSSIQPPDAASDHLRSQLLTILGHAVDGVSAMRIAARRGDLTTVVDEGRKLGPIGAALDRFEQEHSS